MNTIRKAHDRKAQTQLTAREQVALRPESEVSRTGWIPMLVAFVGGVIFGMLVLVFWPAIDASDAGALEPGKAKVASRAVGEPRAQAASQRELHASAEIERKMRAGRSAPLKPSKPKEFELQEKVANLPSAAVLSEPVRIAARKPALIPKPTEKRATGPSLEAPPAPVAKIPPTPTAEIVRPIPEVLVTRTVWHPRAERRSVLVEVSGGAPIKLREGDRVGPLEVGTIEPSGAVFKYDGVEIRHRVGDSR